MLVSGNYSHKEEIDLYGLNFKVNGQEHWLDDSDSEVNI